MKSMKVITAAASALLFGATGASALNYGILPDTVSGNNFFASDLEATFGVGNVGFGFVSTVESTEWVETVTFTDWGSDSGFTNSFEVGGFSPGLMTETAPNPWASAADSVTSTFAKGFLSSDDLKFTTTGSGGIDAPIGHVGMGVFFALDGTAVDGSTDTLFLAYDDNGGNVDDNHDDFMVKTTGSISVVPLPAAAWLLLGVSGGLIAAKRRQARKAA